MYSSRNWILIIFLVGLSVSHPISDSSDESGHLGAFNNQGAPLYFDTGHQNAYDEYPGYDGYASYAPNHDHEHYHYPKYKFEYGVHDPHTGDIKKQYEERDGDTVRGYYSLVEPDGAIRIVEYTADAKHGFQAHVRRIPPTHHHEPAPPTYHYPDYHHYPNHDDDHYYPQIYHPNSYEDEGDYGTYHVYESGENKYPAPVIQLPHASPYNAYRASGYEYDESAENRLYNSNNNYPSYAVAPQSLQSDTAVEGLNAYGDAEDSIENQDKYFNKRSPLKKLLKQPIVVQDEKDESVKEEASNNNVKVLESSSRIKENENAKNATINVTPTSLISQRNQTESVQSSTEKSQTNDVGKKH